jgi:hypothetical protein
LLGFTLAVIFIFFTSHSAFAIAATAFAALSLESYLANAYPRCVPVVLSVTNSNPVAPLSAPHFRSAACTSLSLASAAIPFTNTSVSRPGFPAISASVASDSKSTLPALVEVVRLVLVHRRRRRFASRFARARRRRVYSARVCRRDRDRALSQSFSRERRARLNATRRRARCRARTRGSAYDAILDARTRDAASMERFAALATAPSAVPRAAVEAVVDAGARAALVDVRSPGEYKRGRAPRAINCAAVR